MMIAQDQNEAISNISITSFTVRVARANSAHREKSISCASARVCVSMSLLFVSGPFCFGPHMAAMIADLNRLPMILLSQARLPLRCANLCR